MSSIHARKEERRGRRGRKEERQGEMEKSLDPLPARWSREGGKHTLTWRWFAWRNTHVHTHVHTHTCWFKEIFIHVIDKHLYQTLTPYCVDWHTINTDAPVNIIMFPQQKLQTLKHLRTLKISKSRHAGDTHTYTDTHTYRAEKLWWSWGHRGAGCLGESAEGEPR